MNIRKILSQNFFERDTLTVARELLGKYLVKKIRGNEIAMMITEVEAYDGFEDKASHAHKGETARNKPMFGKAGVWYVYLVYGMHEMLNIVTGRKGYPAAVLIRGVEGIAGPGRLTKFLKITRAQNNTLAGRKSGLWIEDRGVVINNKRIKKTSRIGVLYAGVWAKKKYRFLLK
ncbi:MAG: DNA-3-methyladenine glycosylase [Candidatus Yonathbacteria bacterium]|nr:DNA-3-methyladenine glycosylase [Candidatus Yonathbacteria bacterium]